MLRVLILSFLVLTAILTSGCFGARETDEIAYILVVGLDKSKEDGKVDVTFQIAAPRAIAGEGGKAEGLSITTTFTAETLGEARSLLNSQTARTPTWAHTKIIIIGESLARSGLADVLAPIMRFREFRGSMFIAVVNGDTAQNYIMKNKPQIEVVPSRYYETMLLTADETSYYPQTDLHEFYSKLKSGSASPYAVLVGLNKVSEELKPSKVRYSAGEVDQYKAGNMPRKGSDNPEEAGSNSEFIGTALFHKDKMVGSLTGQEYRSLAMLNGKFSQGYYSVEDPLVHGKKIVVNLRLGQNPKLKTTLDNGQAKIAADVFLEGEITNIASGTNYEVGEYRTLLEEQISQSVQRQILDTLHKTQVLASDIIGFGYLARSSFRTYDEFAKIDWEKTYSQAEVEVNVKTRIRRTGLMWKTMPISFIE